MDPTATSWIIVDECMYNDYWPWPVDLDGAGSQTGPDGGGDSLHRISSAATKSGNDLTSWKTNIPTPAK
jgi:hypothetical protein